jgi:NADH dehydrogenase (ubiquinone) Fe-S protein 3
MLFLKDHTLSQFKNLTDVITYDSLTQKYRFVNIYHLLSIHFNCRIKILTRSTTLQFLNSIVNIFKNANWAEREVFDLFGVFFYNHMNLRRILTDYTFKGHPLRKDFPLIGFVETLYDFRYKKTTNLPITLSQEQRDFNF